MKRYEENKNMENTITIMAFNGEIYNAYKVFNMANISLMQKKPVNIFFDSEAVKFVIKPEFNDLSCVKIDDIDSNNSIKKFPIASINDIIKKCLKLRAKFFVISSAMKELDIKENQLIDGTVVSSQNEFFRYAKDSRTVLYL
jgi:predicted peroxiredoxin